MCAPRQTRIEILIQMSGIPSKRSRQTDEGSMTSQLTFESYQSNASAPSSPTVTTRPIAHPLLRDASQGAYRVELTYNRNKYIALTYFVCFDSVSIAERLSPFPLKYSV